MTDAANDNSNGGVAKVAGKAIDKLTDEFLIVVVVGLVAAAILLAAGAAQNSTVAIVSGAVLVFLILALGAIVYIRKPGGAVAGARTEVPREFELAAGCMNEFADWSEREVVPFPHVLEKRNDDARWFFGERMVKLSEHLGRLRAAGDERIVAIGDRVMKDFERIDPRRENITKIEREIAFDQLRADVDAFTHAFSQ